MRHMLLPVFPPVGLWQPAVLLQVCFLSVHLLPVQPVFHLAEQLALLFLMPLVWQLVLKRPVLPQLQAMMLAFPHQSLLQDRYCLHPPIPYSAESW